MAVRNLVKKAFGMGRVTCLICSGVTAVGIVGYGSAERVEAGAVFHVACTVADTVDKARGQAICDEFIAALKAHTEFTSAADAPAPLTVGPGIEVRMTKASDTMLEFEPTWIDAAGNRTALPVAGIMSADVDLNPTIRQRLYRNLIANRPK